MNITKFYLRSFEEGDTAKVRELINDAFGVSYTTSKPTLFEQPVLIVAIIKGKIVGFCSGNVEIKNIGLLDILVVHPNYQRQGIGSALFKAGMMEFSKHHVNSYILNHWVKKELPEPIIAIKHGFNLKETVVNYWQQESLKFKYHCVECGPPPCKCSCSIYIKN
jgi:GNAT superfamily N-acetyltransferase